MDVKKKFDMEPPRITYVPAKYVPTYMHGMIAGANVNLKISVSKEDHYGRDLYQVLQFAQICENFKVENLKNA